MSIFGKLITDAIDVVALPVKITEGVVSTIVTGGDSRALKKSMPVPSDVIDKMKEIVEGADED